MIINLKNKLLSTNWNSIIGSDSTDIDLSTEKFLNYINETYMTCFPLKHKKISQKRVMNPWLTSDVKYHLNVKSDYFTKFRQGFISREMNNQMRNKVNKIVREAKNKYYLDSFKNFKNNTKKKWDLIHELAGSTSKKNAVSELKVDNMIYSDPSEIADQFNIFFNRIATDLDSQLIYNNKSPLDFVKRNISASQFFLPPITPSACATLIISLKKTKSDISTMPVKIFSSLHGILSIPIAQLINASIIQGKFPKVLKFARVTPVFKRGDKADPSNYRPISCLPYLSKIFERYITNQLSSYFLKHNIISNTQFGFQKGISTLDALINLSESIYNSLNRKNHYLSILIDLKKAFDTMNHAILLQKLELYGVRGLPLALIGSYLADRCSFVQLKDGISDVKTSNIGIPQGSIIGPFLFLTFINDLPNISELFKTYLFADDTTLSISNPDSEQLTLTANSELEKLFEWTISNRLTINVNKTELILFSNRNFSKEENHIYLNENALNYSDNCKFLGVHIDSDMSFKTHINLVVGKLSRGAGILYKIRDSLPKEARLNYYYAMFYPYISFNAIIWASTYKTHLQPIIIQQKRIVRIISNAKIDDHCDPLFLNLGLLKFEDVFKIQLLVYMFKYVNNNTLSLIHDRNTRFNNLLRPGFHRLAKTQHAVSFIGPTLWNELPSTIKNVRSIGSFKSKLKEYFLNQYNPYP